MTTVIQDRDLCRVRLRLVDLFKSFFAEEPDAEKLARWRGIFAALAGARVSRDFDRGKVRITDLLWTKNLIELQQEYRQLSTSPYGGQPLPTLATSSRHDRHDRDRLAEIRIIMAEAGLVRAPAAPAAADSLMVPLDTLAALIEMEKEAGEAPARELAARLVRRLLVPLAENLRTALQRGGPADFYLHCGRLLGSYLELELALDDQGQAIGARRAFARLFAATALLTGAAMTARTVCRISAGPERPRVRRRGVARPRPVRALPTRPHSSIRTTAEALAEDCGVAAAFMRPSVSERDRKSVV